MKTKTIVIEESQMDEVLLQEAGSVIKNGGLVAFPTETVYGLGGDALNPESSRRIYQAKGRPSDNPLIVHISKWEDIYPIVEYVTPQAEKIAKAFWPGPLTIILPKSDKVPLETTGGLHTVAVRLPSHPVARKLIAFSGGYVAAPSANTSGKPSPTLAKYVEEDMQGRIDMIVDGGQVGLGLESTIIDLTTDPPQILRPGFITQEMLKQVLGQVETDSAIFSADSTKAPRAPGMKYRHYAPKGELTIVSGPWKAVMEYINRRSGEDRDKGEKVGIIGTDDGISQYKAHVVKSAGSRQDGEGIARELYRILRELDDEEVTKIYSEAFAGEGIGQAIMNRLLKAAGHKVIYLEEETEDDSSGK